VTQPQQQMGIIPCRECGVIRGAIAGAVVEVGKLSLVGGQPKVTPCPVCTMAEMIVEMQRHIIALEAEVSPPVEEAAG